MFNFSLEHGVIAFFLIPDDGSGRASILFIADHASILVRSVILTDKEIGSLNALQHESEKSGVTRPCVIGETHQDLVVLVEHDQGIVCTKEKIVFVELPSGVGGLSAIKLFKDRLDFLGNPFLLLGDRG